MPSYADLDQIPETQASRADSVLVTMLKYEFTMAASGDQRSENGTGSILAFAMNFGFEVLIVAGSMTSTGLCRCRRFHIPGACRESSGRAAQEVDGFSR